MGGLYDILESYRDRQNKLNYEGLYQDPDRFLDFDNSRVDFTNQADYPFTGNIPTNRRARYDARAYNRNEPLPSPYGYWDGTFFKNFNPRVGFPNTSVFGITPENFSTTGIMEQAPDIVRQAPTQNFEFLSSAYEDDDAEQVDSLTGEKTSSGIMDLIMSLAIPGYSVLKNIGSKFKPDPRAIGIRNFYSPEGLTSTGSIASGIMKGYNPVSGGLFGQPANFGLAGAMQKRIENILGRKAPQTDASRNRVNELQGLQLAEMRDRVNRGESLGSIGKSTFSGPGMAFEKQSGGVSGKGTANERNYGGR